MKKLISVVCVAVTLLDPCLCWAASLPALYKRIGNVNAAGTVSSETTPLQAPGYNNGLPFAITFYGGNDVWPPPPGLPYLVVRDLFSGAIITQVPWSGGGLRGIGAVINGLVNIFATTDAQNVANQNGFVRSTIDQNWNVSAPVTIFNSELYGAGIQAQLGGVTPNPQGGWTMGYSNQYGVGCLDWPDARFTPGQASPSNPSGWVNVPTGGSQSPSFAGNNPQWSASDGLWYQFMQSAQVNPTRYFVSYERSTDRVHWTASPTTVLTPDDMPQIEGINNSDIRTLEFNGNVYVVYLSGDQQTWSNIRLAVFFGSLAQFRASFTWP